MMVVAVRMMLKGGMFVGGGWRMRIDEIPALRRGQMLFQPRQHLRARRARGKFTAQAIHQRGLDAADGSSHAYAECSHGH